MSDVFCDKCGSKGCVKNGHHHGRQRYKCKQCGYQFTGAGGEPAKSDVTKALAVLLYLAGVPYKNAASIVKQSGVKTVLDWVRNYGFKARKSDPEITKDEWHKKHYSFDMYMFQENKRLKANRKDTNVLKNIYSIPYSDGKMPVENDRSFVRNMDTVVDYMRSEKSKSVKRFIVIEVHRYSGEVQKVAITP